MIFQKVRFIKRLQNCVCLIKCLHIQSKIDTTVGDIEKPIHTVKDLSQLSIDYAAKEAFK
jgi:hypothetical protein